MTQVTFLGLGVMGYSMAAHLAKAGYNVTVYNRTIDKAKSWVNEHKGSIKASVSEAVQNASFVFSCVGNDDDLRSITIGHDGAFQNMMPDAIFIDHTKASASVSRELYAEAQKCGLHFLDAPVSGGEAGARNGTLSIMVGGDNSIYDKTEPVLRAYSKSIQYMGLAGAGQLTKMVNQICIAGTLQGLAEGLNFAKAANLDVSKVLNAISKGAAGSWQMDNRGQTMSDCKFDFGFAVDWMRKDLGICLDEATRQSVTLPITALIDQFYSELQQMGYSRADTSSLIMRLYPSKNSS